MDYIESGLPFSEDQFEIVKESNVRVDMSNLHFDIDFKDYHDCARTALIYLRNVGCKNAVLDFSKVDKSQLAEFVKIFINDSIDCSDKYLAYLWGLIIRKYMLKSTNNQVINNEQNDFIDYFIEENESLVKTVCSIVNSFSLALLKTCKGLEQIEDDVQTDAITDIGVNIDKLATDEVLAAVMQNNMAYVENELEKNFTPIWYSKIFNEKNERLMTALRSSTLGFIMSMCIEGSYQDILNNISNDDSSQ